jgi:hypothetical protein
VCLKLNRKVIIMQKSAFNTCLTVLFFCFTTLAWSLWVMAHYGRVIIQWFMSGTGLFAYTASLQAEGFAWAGSLNVLILALFFLASGLLASLVTGMFISQVSVLLQSLLQRLFRLAGQN